VTYPTWFYFPVNTIPPGWVAELIAAVSAAEGAISTESRKTGLSSDAVLKELAPALSALGYQVEANKGRSGKIRRPVLFGENGRETVAYEVDAFHDGLGVAVEVEAGRGARSNAAYRDLIRASLIVDARFLVMLMPIAYRLNDRGKEKIEPAYRAARDQLQAIYASQRLHLPFDGTLLIGY